MPSACSRVIAATPSRPPSGASTAPMAKSKEAMASPGHLPGLLAPREKHGIAHRLGYEPRGVLEDDGIGGPLRGGDEPRKRRPHRPIPDNESEKALLRGIVAVGELEAVI